MIFVIILLLSIGATYTVRYLAIKKSIIDIPNERSSHTIPTPRGGGLAVAIIWFFYLAFEFFHGGLQANLFWALFAGSALSAVGFVDDLIDLNPKVRMFVQVGVSLVGLYFVGGLQRVDFGFYELTNPFLINILSVVGLVWFINLFNFLDGIDAYLGMETLFIFLVLSFVGAGWLSSFNAIILGFLVWNWPKAKIFMGDVGSTLIGYNVGILTIYFANTTEFSVISLLMLSSLFWFDATYTLFRRWRNKEKLSVAHRKHAYQRIVQSGWSHQKTVLYSCLINLFVLLLFYISRIHKNYTLVVFVFLCVAMFGINILVDKRKPFEKN